MEKETTYPKIVKLKDGSFEYHFKGVGKNSDAITKVKNLVLADEFSDGYALVRVKNENGNLVYKFLDLHGHLSEDEYFFASDYSCGQALCQKTDGGAVQFRSFDGVLSRHGYKLDGTTSFKRQTLPMLEDKTPASEKNRYGFAEIPFGKKTALMDMMGTIVEPSDLSKTELEYFLKLGTQFYNYFYNKMPFSKFDKRDLCNLEVSAFLEKLINYKHNLQMIGCLNKNDKQFLEILKSKTTDLAILNNAKKELTV